MLWKEGNDMNYYFRSINPLDEEWSLFKQKKDSITIYYGQRRYITSAVDGVGWDKKQIRYECAQTVGADVAIL